MTNKPLSRTLTFDLIGKMLFDAKCIHRASLQHVEFETENKRHAIYILQGGMLTLSSFALRFCLEGLTLPRSQQWRMLVEALDLILYLNELPDDSRKIKAWFRGEVVTRTVSKTDNPPISVRLYGALTEEQVTSADKTKNNLVDILSKYAMHPTLKNMQANMMMDTNEFDYDCLLTPKPESEINPGIFARAYVIQTLQSLLLPITVFPKTHEEFRLIKGHLDEIEIATKQKTK